MANMNNDNTIITKYKVRPFKDDKQNKHVWFFKDAIGGFNWIALSIRGTKDAQGNVTPLSVEYHSASNIKAGKMLETFLKETYSQYCGSKCKILTSPLNITPGYMPTISGEYVKMLNEISSAELLPYNEFDMNAPRVVDSTAPGGDRPFMFKDYIVNCCASVNIPLEEPVTAKSSIANSLGVIDYSDIDFWNVVPVEEHHKYTKIVDPKVVELTINRREYQKLQGHLMHPTPSCSTRNVYLQGPAGSGKTTMVEVFSYLQHLPHASFIFTVSTDVSDIYGSVTPNTNANALTSWLEEHTEIYYVLRYGGVAELSEIGNAPEGLQASLNDLVYGNNRYFLFQGKTYKVHPKTVFVLTGNLGYEGGKALQPAFRERVLTIYCDEIPCELFAEYQAHAWKPYIDNEDAIKEYVRFMYKYIKHMRETFVDMDQYSTVTPSLCTRSIPTILKGAVLSNGSLQKVLLEDTRAILSGVEDPITSASGCVAKFADEIKKLEQKLFMDKKTVKEGKEELKGFFNDVEVVNSTITASSGTIEDSWSSVSAYNNPSSFEDDINSQF